MRRLLCNAILLLMAMTMTFTPSTTMALATEIPDSAKDFDGHSYEVYNIGETWENAEQYCEKLGGHLLTITSSEEQKFIQTLIKDEAKDYYWLGYLKNDASGKYEWITNESSNYTNWQSGQPNNYQGKEKYGCIFKSNGRWFDNWNNDVESSWLYKTKSGFICEWDGSENQDLTNPGTVDLTGAVKASSTSIKLTWKQVKNAEGYVIYMKTNKGIYKKIKNIKSGETLTYTKVDLDPGNTYSFMIRAYKSVLDDKIFGALSNKRSVKL